MQSILNWDLTHMFFETNKLTEIVNNRGKASKDSSNLSTTKCPYLSPMPFKNDILALK